MVAVHKGRDRWEIAIGPDTKVTKELKVASKVDVKEQAKAKETKKKK